MISWPSLQAYNRALLKSNENLRIPGLANCSLALNNLGLPNALSGGFAYIYQLSHSTGKKALRLFHSVSEERLPHLQQSYALLNTLRQKGLPLAEHLVEARWVDACLRLDTTVVPAVVMDWIQAPTLGTWLEQHYKNREALNRLRYRLTVLQKALEAQQVVHGDLQTGNLAIQGDEQLVLMDYDGLQMASPEYRSWEQGHIHFQHPDTFSNWTAGSTLGESVPGLTSIDMLGRIRAIDRFPFIVIDLGLALLAEKPEFFDQFCQGENIIFTADDFIDPRRSTAIAALGTVPELEGAHSAFISICEGSAAAVPSLEEFRHACGISLTEAGEVHAGPVLFTIATSGEPVPAGDRSRERPGKRKKSYRSVYPVYDGRNFPMGLAAPMGQKIELVGKVQDVKYGETKYGDPYAFVNFTNWRHNGIKLIFWSEGLDACEGREPDASWVGRWVSAIGLVDEPYTNPRYGTVQYSITIHEPNQIRLISEAEALRRLGKDSPLSVDTEPVLDSFPRLSNAELLRQLSKSDSTGTVSPARNAGPAGAMGSTGTPGPASRSHPTPATSKNSSPSRESSGCLWYVIVLLGIFLYFYIKNQ